MVLFSPFRCLLSTKSHSVLCMLALAVTVSSQKGTQLPDGWRKLSVPSCSCTCIMPTPVTTDEKTVATEMGDVRTSTLFSKGVGGDSIALYMVSWSTAEVAWVPADSVELRELFYDESLQSHAQTLKADITYSFDETIEGIQGRVFRLRMPEKQKTVKGKMLLAGNRFYMWQVFTVEDYALHPLLDSFLQSFRLKR